MSEKPSPRDQFAPVAEAYLTSKAHARPDELTELVAQLPSYGTVLDIGTGAGHMAYALAATQAKVVAYDMTDSMLEVVRRESETRALGNVETVLGLAEALPFGHEIFDGVACRLAAHHFDSVSAFLSECFRVTRPGGWLLVIDTIGPEDQEAGREVDWFETQRDPSHRHDFSESEWRALVSQTGFAGASTSTQRKALDFDDWTSRMRVRPETVDELRRVLETSSGGLRDYLAPRQFEGRWKFDLLEMELLANKPV